MEFDMAGVAHSFSRSGLSATSYLPVNLIVTAENVK